MSTAVDTDTFAPFVEGLDYPVFVVTTAADGERAGCLVGFVSQASIDPPRLLVCLSEKNRTYRLARRSDHLAVHLLPPQRHDLAELFGGHTGEEIDKFARCDWSEGPHGLPILEGAQRVCVGRTLRRDDWGDHIGFLLDPVSVETRSTGEVLTLTGVDDIDAGKDA